MMANALTLKAPRELAPHEKALFEQGFLCECTHGKATARCFSAPLGSSVRSRNSARDEKLEEKQFIEPTLLYRHMGDAELSILLRYDRLPDTQPYQTVVEGHGGYLYCRKYLMVGNGLILILSRLSSLEAHLV